MTKVDLKKELKTLYNPSPKHAAIVDVSDMNFLAIDGIGDPNKVPEFHEAVEALYAVSYTLKFTVKKGEDGVDYAVMPLEGLWWAEDMSACTLGARDNWQWTLMISQPDFITQDLVSGAVAQASARKSLPALSKLSFAPFHEGLSAQIMHIGPFSEEPPTIEKLHVFIQDNDFEFNGKHHEIYLSDPRRVAQEKMKTVIRQPVRKV